MTETKPYYKSKSLWAGGLLMFSGVVGFLGSLLSGNDLLTATNGFKETFLLGLGIVGLRTASKKLE